METNMDVTTIPLITLVTHIERCERLLQHPTLLIRLPDGGESIRARYNLYLTEKKRREEEKKKEKEKEEGIETAENIKIVENNAKVPVQEKSTGESQNLISSLEKEKKDQEKFLVKSANSLDLVYNSEAKEVKNNCESYEDAVRSISEKHKNFKIPVEEIVRKTFGGSLCEDEIQRILKDVPPNFFLTHDETISRQRKLLQEERREALERLRRQKVIELQR